MRLNSFVTAQNSLLSIVLFFVFIQIGETAPLVLSSSPRYDLADHMEVLVDPSGQLSLSDILLPSVSREFTTIQGNLNKSYSRATVWLRIELLREADFPSNAWLCLSPPYLDFVTVYNQVGSDPLLPASYITRNLGDHIPVSERPVISPELITPLVLQNATGRGAMIYVKICSTSVLNLEGSIYTINDIVSRNTSYLMIQGGYLGIALVVGLINFIYFLRIRDYLFLFFSLYTLVVGLTHTGITGLITVILPSFAHVLSDYLTGGGSGLSIFFFSLFAIKLFDTARRPLLHCYFIYMCIISVATMVAVPLGFYGTMAQILFFSMLIMISIMVVLSIALFLKKEPGGGLYLAAFGFSNIGYSTHFLRLLGLFPLNWLSLNGAQIGSVVNMILMSLALTERVRAAENKALAAALDSEEKAVELARSMTVELRDEREKLKMALERQILFVDMVSHEYRTPLAIIKANLDNLRDRNMDFSMMTECVSLMQKAVIRLVEVVEASFGVSRLADPIAIQQQYERIEAADFLAEVYHEASTLWPSAILNLPQEESELLFVLADRAQLKTAMFNLIDNAVKYGGNDQSIDIAIENNGHEISLSVIDHGPVQCEVNLDDFRRKFRRGHNTAGQQGIGIGLYLVDSIITQCGGRLQLRPNAPHGMIATIVLPSCC